jgi:homoserine dehydrogenase
MKRFNLCLLGFGNVNRTLIDLLQRKDTELRERYGIEWRITGVASRRIGWQVNASGFDVAELLRAQNSDAFASMRGHERPLHCPHYNAWLDAAQPDVVFEATSLNVENGQPAIDHIRAALEHGAHAITANKGPVVHAYDELRELAARRGKQFLFESTVMDGVPIFALFRNTLPAIEVKGFKGILNSTTNVILTGMEGGLTFDESLSQAQQLGIAETDASHDIDGWDAAVKVAALVNVIMGVRLPPQKVDREGIRGLTGEAVRSARNAGAPYKLICRAQRTESGVSASVRPEQIPLIDPMALVGGTSSIIRFETDIFPGLTITEENPGLYTTAYGMLADFIRAASS